MGGSVDRGRRDFLRIGAAAGGGLLVGFRLPPLARDALADEVGEFTPNAWIRIDRDGAVTLRVASSEMGQGVMTAIPMILAEELDADWARVRVEMAPAAAAYVNPLIGAQLTGGSTSVRAFWLPLRRAGAAARELLVSAAARAWKVPAGSCYAARGAVIHRPSGRRFSYGALASRAARLRAPRAISLKEPDQFQLLGKPVPRIDTPLKVNGAAIFGLDVRLPGTLTAVVARCPVFGGRLRRFDARAAARVKGVREVLAIDSGVAVVADGFWAAMRGRDALVVEWDEGPNARLDSAGIRRRLIAAVRRGGATARREGDVDKALRRAARRVDAVYEVPYLAHACMEPMNCTAVVRADGAEVWAPTQAQTGTQETVARITGLPPRAIQVHTTFLGGGFGRRAEQDFVAEAVELARRMGAPVKVVWTREDDMRHDFYRPATYNRLTAALDRRGRPIVWRHHIAGPSIFARVRPGQVAHGIDPTSVEGAANLPYAIPNLHVSYAMENGFVPVGFWRSVGSSQNAYVTECFVDEVASAARRDPVAFRHALLDGQPRYRGVLALAADKAGWGRALPVGRYRGVAVAGSFGSYVAQVAEISLGAEGVRVHRVVCAIDCGMTVNPDTIVAQMQSGIVFGLTAALKGEITIRAGRVVQGNFHDYPLLGMHEMPQVEVHIVTSREAPGGVGEPGTPPIAPAVANAVFAATGRRVRRLPMRGVHRT